MHEYSGFKIRGSGPDQPYRRTAYHTGISECQSLTSSDHVPGICLAADAVLGQERRSNKARIIWIKNSRPCTSSQAPFEMKNGRARRRCEDLGSSLHRARRSQTHRDTMKSLSCKFMHHIGRAHLPGWPAPQRLHQQVLGCRAPLLRPRQQRSLPPVLMPAALLQIQRLRLPGWPQSWSRAASSPGRESSHLHVHPPGIAHG